MLTIADLAAQTVERAQLYQRQHDLVLELQRRTLPDVPAIAGLAVAARYLPSSSALGLGGDWYEVQPIGDGIVGLVVGDVVGHGIEAIADMTEIRTTVSTLLRTDADLSSVVSASSALLATVGRRRRLRHRRADGRRPRGASAALRPRRSPAADGPPSRRHGRRCSTRRAPRRSVSPVATRSSVRSSCGRAR